MIGRLCASLGLCLCFASPASFARAAGHPHGATSAPAVGSVPLYTGLGNVHHAITTHVPLAQRYFDQGLALCYAFNHDEAIRAFTQAAALSPDCLFRPGPAAGARLPRA